MLSDGSIINCKILDTGGAERFRALNENYYKKADGCILVYDITCEKSFNEIKEYYIPKLKENCKENIKTILLGNKSDKEDERIISPEEGAQLALENNFIFKETTCFERTNVANAFQTIIEITNIDMKRRERENNGTIKINKKSKKSNGKKTCC